MNIIRIGEEYVNLDNVTGISLHGHEVLVVTDQRNRFISTRPSDIDKLRELLNKMSDKTKKDWED